MNLLLTHINTRLKRLHSGKAMLFFSSDPTENQCSELSDIVSIVVRSNVYDDETVSLLRDITEQNIDAQGQQTSNLARTLFHIVQNRKKGVQTDVRDFSGVTVGQYFSEFMVDLLKRDFKSTEDRKKRVKDLQHMSRLLKEKGVFHFDLSLSRNFQKLEKKVYKTKHAEMKNVFQVLLEQYDACDIGDDDYVSALSDEGVAAEWTNLNLVR